MILLREQNLLFLKPHKVGGTSFEIALSKFAGADDILTPISKSDETLRLKLGYRTAQNYGTSRFEGSLASYLNIKKLITPKRPKKFFNHISAKVARSRLGEDVWQRSFKVSIVRNPFDKLVSQYFWVSRSQSSSLSLENFESWIRSNPKMMNDNDAQYLIDGEDIIDHYIRYEDIRNDIFELEQIKPGLSGLYDAFSNLRAKGSSRPKSSSTTDMYLGNPSLVEAVRFFND